VAIQGCWCGEAQARGLLTMGAMRWGVAGLLAMSIPMIRAPAARATANDTAPCVPQPTAAVAAADWYGWQSLASDAGAVALFTTAGLLSNAADHGAHDRTAAATTFWLGLGTYALGGPIVHLAHDRPAAMVRSLAMRLLLPVGGGIAALPAARILCSSDDGEDGLACLAGTFVVGAGLGLIAAAVLDAALLARVPRADGPGAAERTSLVVFPSHGGAVARYSVRF